MRILVTGGTGFVGSHAIERMLGAGHEVRMLIRDPDKAKLVLGNLGVEVPRYTVGDMLDPDSVAEAVDDCDAALHAAAAVAITGQHNESLVAVNVDGTHNVIDAALAKGMDPIVYLSTGAVFLPPSDAVVHVDSPFGESHNPYGQSKIEAEKYVRRRQAEGAPITTIYPGGVYGPDQPVLEAGNEGLKGALEIFWPMTTGGISILDVGDLAEMILRCMEPAKGSRRFLASGHYVSWPEFADLCDELTGRRCRRATVPPVALRALARILDFAKRIRGFDYPLTYDAAQYMTTWVPGDDSETIETLDMEYRSVRETIEASLRWLAASGYLKPKYAGEMMTGAWPP